MPYALEPLVAGELGPETVLDASTHPPRVESVQYLLDFPTDEALIESFPVFLVSEVLAADLEASGLVGFRVDEADTRLGTQYARAYDIQHTRYRWLQLMDLPDADCWLDGEHRLCVSDDMYSVLTLHNITRCDVSRL